MLKRDVGKGAGNAGSALQSNARDHPTCAFWAAIASGVTPLGRRRPKYPWNLSR